MTHFIAALWLLTSITHAHEAGEMSIQVGPNNGVTEFSEKSGFKLNPLAEKRLKLVFKAVEKDGKITLPKDAIVKALGVTGVYRKRDGYIKRIDVGNYARTSAPEVALALKDLKSGDQVLAEGVGFVRIIEASFGAKGEEDEHGDHGHGDEKEHGEEHEDEHGHEEKDEHGHKHGEGEKHND